MRNPSQLLLWFLIIIYVWLFAGLAFAQHSGMRTHKADLGQMDQAVWNSSHGRFLEMTDNGYISTRMTDHVEPILVLISPVLWLWDDVRALLLLQVVAVAIGAWFVYGLAMMRLEQLLTPHERSQVWLAEPLRRLAQPLAFSLAIAFLLAPQLQSAVLTELHAIPLAVPLILWAFWAIEKQRWGQFTAAVLLLAGVKEEAALLAAGLGVWAIWQIVWRRWQSRAGLILASLAVLASLAWFYAATFVIVPSHAVEVYGVAESSYFQRYGALGDSPLDIVKRVITRPALVWQIASEPARLAYLRGLVAPFGFLSLLAPEILLLSLPVLLANLLSAYPAQYYGEFHYSAPLMPYMAVAAAYGMGRVWGWLGRRTARTSAHFQHLAAASLPAMVLASGWRNARTALRPLLAALLALWVLGWAFVVYAQAGHGPWGARYDPTPVTEHHRLLPRFLAQIPDEAAVTTTAAVHPHVSHRRYIYQFPVGLETPTPAEWALLDVTTATDMAPGDVKFLVDGMLATDWGVVDAADGFLLLHIGEPDKVIPDAFYDFARAPAASASAETGAVFSGHTVEDWPRWRQTRVTTYWRAGPAPIEPQIELRTPAGETLYRFADATPPALIWYPPDRWRPGETVRITTLPLSLPRAWGLAVEAKPGLDITPSLRQDAPQVELHEEDVLLIAAYVRGQDGQFYPAPALQDGPGDFAANLSQLYGVQTLYQNASLSLPGGAAIQVETWLPVYPLEPGASVDLWLRWQGAPVWPAGQEAFVHLRHNAAPGAPQDNVVANDVVSTNVAQNDGLPRYFVRYAIDRSWAEWGGAADWRQLQTPDGEETDGVWSVVVGLYDVQSGQRAAVSTPGGVSGEELVAGRLPHGPPPVPDQTCALIPATCASQPLR
jgi:uncharacterized membrane protein